MSYLVRYPAFCSVDLVINQISAGSVSMVLFLNVKIYSLYQRRATILSANGLKILERMLNNAKIQSGNLF